MAWGLCLTSDPGKTNINIEKFKYGGVLEVRGKGWQLKSERGDMNIGQWSNRFAGKCVNDICIYYRRHCSATKCDYSYEVGKISKDEVMPNHFTVSASNPKILSEALNSIGIRLKADDAVPLSDLDQNPPRP